MHAMGGVIDMRRFGGLRRLMPVTHGTFLFGCLALAGVVPFAGFWSKDAILAAAYEKGAHDDLFYALYWGGLIVALMTAIYTFRAFFLTFYGPERIPHEAGHHAHESRPAR
jgi:NADH-quinone oxidoreductase subunit L